MKALVTGATGFIGSNSSKAIKELGLPQTPIRTTVTKAVNWFKENGYVKTK